MPASTYIGNKMLDCIVRGVGFASPVRVFVSLHTADPGDNGANEVTKQQWPTYQRADAANGEAVGNGFTVAKDKNTQNIKEISWPPLSGQASVNLTHFALWDAQINGNCLWVGALSQAKKLMENDECIIRIGQMKMMVV